MWSSIRRRDLAVWLFFAVAGVAALLSWSRYWRAETSLALVRTDQPPSTVAARKPSESPEYCMPVQYSEPARLPFDPAAVPLASSSQEKPSFGGVRGIAELPQEDPLTPLAAPQKRYDGVVRVSAEEEPSVLPPRPSRPLSEASTVHFREPEASESQQPAGGTPLRIPLAGTPPPEAIQMNVEGGLVTIVAHDAPLGDVLGLLARQQGLNIISSEDIKTPGCPSD